MWDEAIELLEGGINKDLKNSNLYFYLGQVYSQKNEVDKAIYNINKAINLYKNKSDVKPLIEYHRMLGHIYYYQVKDFEKAIGETEIILNFNRLDAWAYFVKAMCYKKMDSDPKEMINLFKKAVFYKPDEVQYRIALAETFYIYGLYRETLTEWEDIKRFKSYEDMANEKIREINNAIKEEQRNVLNKRR